MKFLNKIKDIARLLLQSSNLAFHSPSLEDFYSVSKSIPESQDREHFKISERETLVCTVLFDRNVLLCALHFIIILSTASALRH